MEHKDDEFGVWAAYGEDQSMGAMYDPIREPFLGHFEGAYSDVLAHVKKKKNWVSYGKGGRIVKISIEKIG